MEAAIARCRETGLVVMALRNAHHSGRVGRRNKLAERSAAGIPVEDVTWEEIMQAGAAVGLNRPVLEAIATGA